MSARILLLDDEARMVEIIAMVLRREGYDVHAFNQPERALTALAEASFDLLVTDLRMPGMDGLEVLRRARELQSDLPVILITAHATIATAIEAMKEGAVDYVEKPFNNEELKALAKRALDLTRLARENRYLRAELKGRYAPGRILGESPAMREVMALVARSARSRSTVLISGESGTGKELVARALHYESDRVSGPFVAANCKALAEGVLESELFGHERGAFTGADRARPGLFEQAHQGTLFLDEIGEIGDAFQAKLLRVLQERSVRRVGGEQSHEVDVRVIAATNRNLKHEVAAGRFREDLYFRLAVIPLHLPPLRDRSGDVLPLARHFLARWNRELGRQIEGFSDDVEAYLEAHPWPGNVRELENAVERGVVLARGTHIEQDDLLLDEDGGQPDAGARAESLHAFLDAAAADRIRTVLIETSGARSKAADRLGVDRTTLYRLMRKYEID